MLTRFRELLLAEKMGKERIDSLNFPFSDEYSRYDKYIIYNASN